MGYKSTILADSPIRYYRLDEASYKVADSSGNGHPAAIGGTITTGVGSLVGNSDTCMTFDGTNSLIIGSNAGIPTSASAFSLECWIKFASAPGASQVCLSIGAWAGNDGAYVGIDPTGKPIGGNHNTGNAAASALSTGTAHHLVATYDGTTYKVYADGTQVLSNAATMAISAAGVFIGEITGKQFMFVGQIGQVAIYNVALSSTQVANHHSATGSGYDAAVLADSPVSYWTLSDGLPGSTVATDSSTSAQNGTYHMGMGSAPSLLVGDSDTAMFFAGISNVSIPSTSLPTGASVFSLEAWIQIAAYPAAINMVFLSIGSGTTPNGSTAELYVNTSGQVAVSVAGTDTTLSSAISLNTRHHIVGTWDGTTLRCYVDGSQTGTSLPTMNLTAHTATIGSDANGGTFYFGIVDEVAIYNVALSSTQITAHYNAGITPVVPVTNRVGGDGDYLCQAQLNWFRGISYPAPPATIYLGLFSAPPDGSNTGGTELSGNNYSRAALDSTKWSSPATPGGSGPGWWMSYNAAITFPTPSANWASVGWLGLFDAASGGNLLRFGPCAYYLNFTAGNAAVIPNDPSNGAMALITNRKGDYLSKAYLNWYRGTSFPSAPSTLYVALYTVAPTGPSGTGGECNGAGYARVAIPADTVHYTQPQGGGSASAPWSISNVGAINWGFPQNNVPWGPLAAIAHLDAPGAPANLLAYGPLSGDTSGSFGRAVLINAGGNVLSDR